MRGGNQKISFNYVKENKKDEIISVEEKEEDKFNVSNDTPLMSMKMVKEKNKNKKNLSLNIEEIQETKIMNNDNKNEMYKIENLNINIDEGIMNNFVNFENKKKFVEIKEENENEEENSFIQEESNLIPEVYEKKNVSLELEIKNISEKEEKIDEEADTIEKHYEIVDHIHKQNILKTFLKNPEESEAVPFTDPKIIINITNKPELLEQCEEIDINSEPQANIGNISYNIPEKLIDYENIKPSDLENLSLYLNKEK